MESFKPYTPELSRPQRLIATPCLKSSFSPSISLQRSDLLNSLRISKKISHKAKIKEDLELLSRFKKNNKGRVIGESDELNISLSRSNASHLISQRSYNSKLQEFRSFNKSQSFLRMSQERGKTHKLTKRIFKSNENQYNKEDLKSKELSNSIESFKPKFKNSSSSNSSTNNKKYKESKDSYESSIVVLKNSSGINRSDSLMYMEVNYQQKITLPKEIYDEDIHKPSLISDEMSLASEEYEKIKIVSNSSLAKITPINSMELKTATKEYKNLFKKVSSSSSG